MKKFDLVRFDCPHNIYNGSLCLPFPGVGNIRKVRTRTEGFVNWDWTIELTDGRIIDLYSIDGERPLFHVEEDHMEYIVDNDFSKFLFEDLPQPPIGDVDEGRLELEWELDYENGRQFDYRTTILDIHNYEDDTILDVLTGKIKKA